MTGILTGFTAGLLLITVSELGDKSFFISAILASRHPRRWVFAGVTTALFLMTILSVIVGQFSTLFPQQYVQGIAIALFLGFGFKLLYDAARMPCSNGLDHECHEALEAVNHHTSPAWIYSSVGTVLTQAFTLTFIAEWGDRTQLATITLSAANHPLGVAAGATAGHAICAAIAVVCGKLMAGRISERWLTAIGGALFVGFGIVTLSKSI